METANDYIAEILRQIEPDSEVLAEARTRRDLVAAKAMSLRGTLRQYSSGSVAHGNVTAPINDADGGIVLDRRIHTKLGPEGDNEGPEKVIEELKELVGPKIRAKYSKARISTSRRGLLVTFGSPLSDQDPSVDMIVTLTRKKGDGLWIPNLKSNTWDASHPEQHTDLFTSGTTTLRQQRSTITRLAKVWNKQFTNPALSSFNVSSLAWELITKTNSDTAEALQEFFALSAQAIGQNNTKDPAGVSSSIRLLQSRSIAVRRLQSAARSLEKAISSKDPNGIQESMAAVFHHYVDPPASSKAAWAAAFRNKDSSVGVTASGLAIGTGETLKSTRSFGGPAE